MAKLKNRKYTLIRNSAFSSAVMLSTVDTERQEKVIREANGVIFDDYQTADDAEFRFNYAGVESVVPACHFNGSFISRRHNGEPLFVPKSA